MKNQNFQNNLILSIVGGVLAVIGICVVYFNKPEPQSVPDPEKVPAVNIAVPKDLVVTSKGLPGADSNQSGGGGLAGGGGVRQELTPNGGAGGNQNVPNANFNKNRPGGMSVSK